MRPVPDTYHEMKILIKSFQLKNKFNLSKYDIWRHPVHLLITAGWEIQEPMDEPIHLRRLVFATFHLAGEPPKTLPEPSHHTSWVRPVALPWHGSMQSSCRALYFAQCSALYMARCKGPVYLIAGSWTYIAQYMAKHTNGSMQGPVPCSIQEHAHKWLNTMPCQHLW